MGFLPGFGGGGRGGGKRGLYLGKRSGFVAGRERGSQVEDWYGMCCRICTGGESIQEQLCDFFLFVFELSCVK